MVKLRDYESRWAELEASDNPFAIVVMAHLKTRATRGDHESRLRWKTHLVRRLYQRGYGRQDVLNLFWFIDWLMQLPEELEQQFEDVVERLETETSMRYVTSIERRAIKRGLEQGIERGLEQGILQGEASALRRLLKRRFERLPKWAEERLEGASREELESWFDRVIEAEALEEVFA